MKQYSSIFLVCIVKNIIFVMFLKVCLIFFYFIKLIVVIVLVVFQKFVSIVVRDFVVSLLNQFKENIENVLLNVDKGSVMFVFGLVKKRKFDEVFMSGCIVYVIQLKIDY